MTRVYIAGPITGLPDFNYPAFHAAAVALAARGFIALSPTHDDTTLAWEHYMRRSIRMVTDADAICLLPGWQQSKGAQLEVTIAEALGLDIRPLDEWLKEKILA